MLRVCKVLLHPMEQMSADFGVPLALEKTEGLVTVIWLLGIEIDSDRIECRLLEHKLLDLRQVVVQVCHALKIRLRELHSLLGKLNFACCIIPVGQVFCRRLAMATAGVSVPTHFVRLPAVVRDDLSLWFS